MGFPDIFAAHVAIHGVASDRYDAANGIGFGVGRAFIDFNGLVVREEQTLLNQRGVGCLCGYGHFASDPRVRGCTVLRVWRQTVAIIIRIHEPADLQLFHVVRAVGLEPSRLGSGERGQEHGRQDGDDGDDDEQFDQREGWAG